MSEHETEHRPAVWQDVAAVELLEQILEELRRPIDWGSAGDIERLYWDPAAPTAQLQKTAEYAYDGVFRSIGIFNLMAAGANPIRVAFTPNQSLTDRTSLFTVAPRGFIILPYRGTTVSVSGDAAGSALIVPFEVPQPVNAGVF